jgi:hypothetical protein
MQKTKTNNKQPYAIAAQRAPNKQIATKPKNARTLPVPINKPNQIALSTPDMERHDNDRRTLMGSWIKELAAVLKQAWFLPTSPRAIVHTCSMDYISMGLCPDRMYKEAIERLGPTSQDFNLAVAQVLDGNIPLELHPLVWRHLGPKHGASAGQWRRVDEPVSKSVKKRKEVTAAECWSKCSRCKRDFDSLWSYSGHKRACHKKRHRLKGISDAAVAPPKPNVTWLIKPAKKPSGNATTVRLPRFQNVANATDVALKIVNVEAAAGPPPAQPAALPHNDMVIAVERHPPLPRTGSYCGILHAPANAPVSWLADAIARKWFFKRSDFQAAAPPPSMRVCLMSMRSPPRSSAVGPNLSTDDCKNSAGQHFCRRLIHSLRDVVQEHFNDQVVAAYRNHSCDALDFISTPPTIADADAEHWSGPRSWVAAVWPNARIGSPSLEFCEEVLEFVKDNYDDDDDDLIRCAIDEMGEEGATVELGVRTCTKQPEAPKRTPAHGGMKQLWEHTVATAEATFEKPDFYVFGANAHIRAKDPAISDVLHTTINTYQPAVTSMGSRVLIGEAEAEGNSYFTKPHSKRFPKCTLTVEHNNLATVPQKPDVQYTLTLLARNAPRPPEFYTSPAATLGASRMQLSAAMPLY